MLEQLKEEVLKANLDLVKHGLVLFTWGNVSGIDRSKELVVIKPSGVEYDHMTIDDLVVVDLNGKVIEGKYNPSSDTPTHLELYKKYLDLGGVTHTHSTYATAYAQAGMEIPCYGTTHADYFYGTIPCTRLLTQKEIENDYEKNTGLVIIKTIRNPLDIPAVLVQSHGVFTFGKNASASVYHAVVTEEVAKMAYLSNSLVASYPNDLDPVDQYLLDKHYLRKHGKNAYYGQKGEKK
jgi:L-ribulose-5-phosphate 4-epimerase